jgi:hypothetical protein
MEESRSGIFPEQEWRQELNAGHECRALAASRTLNLSVSVYSEVLMLMFKVAQLQIWMRGARRHGELCCRGSPCRDAPYIYTTTKQEATDDEASTISLVVCPETSHFRHTRFVRRLLHSSPCKYNPHCVLHSIVAQVISTNFYVNTSFGFYILIIPLLYIVGNKSNLAMHKLISITIKRLTTCITDI